MYAPFGTMRRTSSWRAFLGKKESPQPMLFSSLAKSSKYRAVLPTRRGVRGSDAHALLSTFQEPTLDVFRPTVTITHLWSATSSQNKRIVHVPRE